MKAKKMNFDRDKNLHTELQMCVSNDTFLHRTLPLKTPLVLYEIRKKSGKIREKSGKNPEKIRKKIRVSKNAPNVPIRREMQ